MCLLTYEEFIETCFCNLNLKDSLLPRPNHKRDYIVCSPNIQHSPSATSLYFQHFFFQKRKNHAIEHCQINLSEESMQSLNFIPKYLFNFVYVVCQNFQTCQRNLSSVGPCVNSALKIQAFLSEFFMYIICQSKQHTQNVLTINMQLTQYPIPLLHR